MAAGRNQIGQSVVVTVVVKMIHTDQFTIRFGPPSEGYRAPKAGNMHRTDGVKQHLPVSINPTSAIVSQRMTN
jgi:hypothetical protein